MSGSSQKKIWTFYYKLNVEDLISWTVKPNVLSWKQLISELV
jgi:hypothetical protein